MDTQHKGLRRAICPRPPGLPIVRGMPTPDGSERHPMALLSERAAGVLLHPTSLPGPHGIGDLGPEAYRWVDFLARSGMSLWQVLPMGPTGFGDSPYQSFSAFAGNPALVSPEALVADGLLAPADLANAPALPGDRVEYGPVIGWKHALLDRAFERFEHARGPLRDAFDAFTTANAAWLEDFALFMALKQALGRTWNEWDPDLALRRPASLTAARAAHARALEVQRFRQFVFS